MPWCSRCSTFSLLYDPCEQTLLLPRFHHSDHRIQHTLWLSHLWQFVLDGFKESWLGRSDRAQLRISSCTVVQSGPMWLQLDQNKHDWRPQVLSLTPKATFPKPACSHADLWFQDLRPFTEKSARTLVLRLGSPRRLPVEAIFSSWNHTGSRDFNIKPLEIAALLEGWDCGSAGLLSLHCALLPGCGIFFLLLLLLLTDAPVSEVWKFQNVIIFMMLCRQTLTCTFIGIQYLQLFCCCTFSVYGLTLLCHRYIGRAFLCNAVRIYDIYWMRVWESLENNLL